MLSSYAKNFFKKYVGILFLIIALLGLALFLINKREFFKKDSKDVSEFATEVLATCATKSSPTDCYNKEIPKLMDRLSMKDAFAVTKVVVEKDPQFGYCHTLAHKLSGRETAKNPDHWKEVITQCPTDICNYGCLHGPLLQRYSKNYLSDEEIEKIKPELKEVCEKRPGWDPASWDQAMCYHGLGHLTMYITKGDLQKSVELCRFLGAGKEFDYFSTCLEGVFMQIFQPLEEEDKELIRGISVTKESASSFCDKFEEKVRYNCWRESWPMHREELMKPEGLLSFCSYPKDEEGKKSCRGAVINLITTVFAVDEGKTEKVNDYCSALPHTLAQECLEMAGARLIQISPEYLGKAAALCREVLNKNLREACLQSLAGLVTNRFHPGSEEFKHYCRALPEPWNAKCLEKK